MAAVEVADQVEAVVVVVAVANRVVAGVVRGEDVVVVVDSAVVGWEVRRVVMVAMAAAVQVGS